MSPRCGALRQPARPLDCCATVTRTSFPNSSLCPECRDAEATFTRIARPITKLPVPSGRKQDAGNARNDAPRSVQVGPSDPLPLHWGQPRGQFAEKSQKIIARIAVNRTQKGEPSRRSTPDARPRAHVAGDTAEVRGIAGGGVHQGEERDSSGPGVCRAQAQLCRAALLGQRVLCRESRHAQARPKQRPHGGA